MHWHLLVKISNLSKTTVLFCGDFYWVGTSKSNCSTSNIQALFTTLSRKGLSWGARQGKIKGCSNQTITFGFQPLDSPYYDLILKPADSTLILTPVTNLGGGGLAGA